ncbi:DUF4488 domain-containing protein [Paludibacter sp. 221]|uniref:DUF4488 domain-containing protein n=1 Tax=Paludibacter sp. 221 TaxID=2302939 RepID=UPI0013D6F4F7|nr:DUF4488 domain-containing protein [Paludibacter sp. 221]NDV46732.1 DUF4488 domain-containing protein [Paludibacter sp. 221]
MKNKSLIFLLLFTLLCASCSSVKNVRKTDPKLVGVWQMCGTVSENMDPVAVLSDKRLPFFKVLSSDGNFNNLFMSFNHFYVIPNTDFGKANVMNPERASSITAYGTYHVSGKGRYVESIAKSYTNPMHNGVDNELTYEFVGDNLMIISYTLNKSATGQVVNRVLKELWIRLEGGNPNAGFM